MKHLLQFNKIFLVLWIIIRTADAQLTHTSFNLVKPGENMMGKSGATLTSRSKLGCSNICISDALCQGYQYQKQKKGLGKCILIHKGCDTFEITSSVVTYKKVSGEQPKLIWNPPLDWTGPSAVLYQNFDNSDGFILMEGLETALSSVPLVSGKVNCAWSLNRTMSQWVDLGIHTETCMTRPETCGAAGGAISLWANIIECPDWGGIISSVSWSTGSVIFCSSGYLRFQIHVPDRFLNKNHPQTSGWLHIVLTYIENYIGETFNIYYDGEEVVGEATEYNGGPRAGTGRIVVGRRAATQHDKYASMQVDELIYFDQTLTHAEARSIYNSA